MGGSHTLRIGGRNLRGRSYRFQHPQVRPTRQIVREAILNILRSRVVVSDNDTVLVPFAGSGLPGFDLHSAFGCQIVFNDSDRSVCNQLLAVIQDLSLQEHCSVVPGNIRQTTARLPVASGIFVDPPYDSGWFADIAWLQTLAESSHVHWILTESETAIPELDLPGFGLLVRREYGTTAIQLYAKTSAT